MTSGATPRTALRIPELGPALGRLVTPLPDDPGGSTWLDITEIRHELVSSLFELAGEAREWDASHDRELALTSLNRTAWLGAWEHAVGSVARQAGDAVNARFIAAAAESRMPQRRLRRMLLTPAEVLGIAGRLGAGAAPLLAALETLENAIQLVRSAARSEDERHESWRRALTGTGRRLEAAWLALEEALEREWQRWAPEIARVREWRRPLWPLWLVACLLFASATYLGLVLGGYLSVPPPLQPLAQAWWRRF